MRVIKNAERKPVTIELTPREADLLYEICRNIGGDPRGPRGFIGALSSALYDEGAEQRGLIDGKYTGGMMLKDSW